MHKEITENHWSKYQCQEVRKMEGSRKNYKNKNTCIMWMFTYKENRQWQKLVTGKD